MATKNDITGDAIQTKVNSDAYRNSPFWDSIKKDENKSELQDLDIQDSSTSETRDNP